MNAPEPQAPADLPAAAEVFRVELDLVATPEPEPEAGL